MRGPGASQRRGGPGFPCALRAPARLQQHNRAGGERQPAAGCSGEGRRKAVQRAHGRLGHGKDFKVLRRQAALGAACRQAPGGAAKGAAALVGANGKGGHTAKREAPRAVVRRCGGWRERLAGRAPRGARTGMRRERAVRWLFVHWSFVWGQRSLPPSQHDWNAGGLRQTGAEARCGHALPVARQFARALTAAAPSAGPDHPTVGAPAIVRGSLAQAPPLPKQQGRTG